MKMKRNPTWLVLTWLVVTALVLGSCTAADDQQGTQGTQIKGKVVDAPATGQKDEKAEEEAPVVPPGAETVRDALGRVVEKPRYGGIIIGTLGADTLGFDEGYVTQHGQAHSLSLTNEALFAGDYAKGPTGSDESSWRTGLSPLPMIAPLLAESWELGDSRTMIFHIRQGVRFHNKPPVNGREVTADDVAFSLTRLHEIPRSYMSKSYGKYFESATAVDKWTVEVKVPEERAAELPMAQALYMQYVRVVPRDLIEASGDMTDWEDVTGTGPFLLTDYVSGSSLTFARNPDYWRKHPLFPEDTMPYADGVRILIIADVSTRIAGLRTAKLDMVEGVLAEDFLRLKETDPGLLGSAMPATPYVISMRTDTEPFDDINVRRALSMAIDRQAIVDDYYRGEASVLGYPVQDISDHRGMYTPLEELPESVQELFTYDPDKARQLLADAGYPDGFKTTILAASIETLLDQLSVVSAYWADIGVELKIDAREYGVWSSMRRKSAHEQMLYTFQGVGVAIFKLLPWTPGKIQNSAIVNDPVMNEAVPQALALFMDDPGRRSLLGELVPYILDQAWQIEFPTPNIFTVWQPWLKAYSGETRVGYGGRTDWFLYPWVDQDLKESITGSR